MDSINWSATDRPMLTPYGTRGRCTFRAYGDLNSGPWLNDADCFSRETDAAEGVLEVRQSGIPFEPFCDEVPAELSWQTPRP